MLSNDIMKLKETYTPKEFTEILGMNPRTLLRWNVSGRLVAKRNPVNNRRYYTKQQLIDCIRCNPQLNINIDDEHDLSQPTNALTNARIAKFEKVPFDTFKENMRDFLEKYPVYKSQLQLSDNNDNFSIVVKQIYDDIKLPARATSASAGYDFYAPFDFFLDFMNPVITVPTGIRCKIAPNWFLALNVRSGHGFKFGIKLANTQGIIDSDYYSENEPRTIMAKLTYDPTISGKKDITITKGTAFVQGIFMPYGLTIDDNADGKRTGAFGSTDEKGEQK